MRIRTDHHAAWKRIILQNHLVDDARTGLPEADAVFVGNGLEEIVNLIVLVDSLLQIRIGLHLGLNQVIAVHRRGYSGRFLSGLHELQQRHLRCRVLHGDAVGSEIHVIHSALVRAGGITFPQVAVQDFFCQGQGLARDTPCRLNSTGDALVMGADHVQIKSHGVDFQWSAKVSSTFAIHETRTAY